MLARGSNGPDDAPLSRYLIYVETSLSILFVCEYAIRFYFLRWRYTFSFFGNIDLVAILPGLLVRRRDDRAPVGTNLANLVIDFVAQDWTI